ncbi:MAG: flagellar basal-body rod protein FlgF [bacterium]
MIKGIFSAAAGMLPRINQQETVGNNLANVNTVGFKADRRYFSHELNSHMLAGGASPASMMSSPEVSILITDFSPGILIETRNPLDVALSGTGFFVLETGESHSYTRAGNFTLNAQGELVNSQGHRVLGAEGPIRIEGKDVKIRSDGTIFVDDEPIGSLLIIDFPQPYQLKRNGWGYFVTNPSQEPIIPDKVEVRQGFLENSNVDPILEMLQMIELNRSYESCQKAILSQDETLKLAVTDLPKLKG